MDLALVMDHGVAVANTLASTNPVADGILDWINTTAGSVGDTVRIVFGVAILIGIALMVAKAGFRVPSILMGLVAGGFAMWLVIFNGLEWFGQRLNEEVNALGGVDPTAVMAVLGV